jgi:hypothetical protein
MSASSANQVLAILADISAGLFALVVVAVFVIVVIAMAKGYRLTVSPPAQPKQAQPKPTVPPGMTTPDQMDRDHVAKPGGVKF